jgi:glycosyltransferase involved in cell wall biosynthesis
LYAAADVFVLPSYLEGFGLVYAEAAMHGVPSIGADVGSVPEVVKHGETGLIVPPAQPDALAAAILSLRDNGALCSQLGANARARAHAEFTEPLVADRYIDAFRS